MRILINIFTKLVVYLLFAMVTSLMLLAIVQYYPLNDHTAFLRFKQEYIQIGYWKIAFYTHVFSIAFALLAGFTQFSSTILNEHRWLHRLMGKVYLYDVFINFPVAMIMAIYANGLLPGKIAFVVLDCLWLWFTWRAVVEIKKGNIRGHRNFMIRSYALTLSAISLRLWKIVILYMVIIDPVHLYMIQAWIGFVPNMLFAEWLIRRKPRASG